MRVFSTRPINQPERRASVRFPIERQVRYRVSTPHFARVTGNGKTLNISSGGMLIATDHPLSAGWSVEVQVDWQEKTHPAIPARMLVAMCSVVRSESGTVALAGLKISRFKFQPASEKFWSESPDK